MPSMKNLSILISSMGSSPSRLSDGRRQHAKGGEHPGDGEATPRRDRLRPPT
jgi:hypothetical protein